MITLHGFGPAFGLPDPSPFVTKVEMLLKLSGLPYRTDTGGLRGAPKGKLPFIDDDGEIVADSTLIRGHLERRHSVDFDRGLNAEQKATGWAFEKMAEDNLYWTAMHSRWTDDANFNKGARHFFDAAPAPIRPLIIAFVRRKVRNGLWAQGLGRHAPADIAAIGCRSVEAMADYLGDKPYFFGAEPSGTDATMFAFAAGTLCPQFDSPMRDAAERRDNLRRYVGRIAARFYPDSDAIAGCPKAA